MATASLVSIGEHLATSYRPDREMLDGLLVERNEGEFDHSNLQRALILWFGQREREWNIRVLPEQRMRVSPTRFRIPDICLISRDLKPEPVFTQPPLACIEVLSKHDTLHSLQDRIDDYRLFGVANIWIIDPANRRGYICGTGDFREPENGAFQIEGTSIRLTLSDLFANLD